MSTIPLFTYRVPAELRDLVIEAHHYDADSVVIWQRVGSFEPFNCDHYDSLDRAYAGAEFLLGSKKVKFRHCYILTTSTVDPCLWDLVTDLCEV